MAGSLGRRLKEWAGSVDWETMCTSKAEGGQRCAGHCAERVATAQERFDRTGLGDDLQALLLAETDYASTPDGHVEALRKAAVGLPGPGGLPPEYWQRIADNGELLRERNVMVAQIAKEAVVRGDAFHAATQEQAGADPVPEMVRGPKSLDQYLDVRAENMCAHTHGVREAASELAALDLMLDRIAGATPDPDASYACGTPRSEDEKRSWVQHLGGFRNEARHSLTEQCDQAGDTMEVLARFGRPTAGFGPALREPQTPNDLGFVGRIREGDGTLSEDAYVVYQRAEDDTVTVWSLRAAEAVPDGFGRVDTAGVCVAQHEGSRRAFVAAVSLERADEATWARFVGMAPSDFAGGVAYMRTAGQRQERDFDNFRLHFAFDHEIPFPDIHYPFGRNRNPKPDPVKPGPVKHGGLRWAS